MKCMSCEAIIDPKWRHSIAENICPFCGKDIMAEELKNLLSHLSTVMDGLKNYPEQLNDYMFSNYNYIKSDSLQLKTFTSKDQNTVIGENKIVEKIIVKVGDQEQEIETKKVQSDEKTSEFFKRADAIRPNLDGFNSTAEKTKHFKNIIQQIRKSGTTVMDENGDASTISAEILAEMESDPSQEIHSAIDVRNGDDEIPAAVLAMAAKGKASGQSNAADMIKLQQLQSRVKQSRENFENGSNRGKGGFSRA